MALLVCLGVKTKKCHEGTITLSGTVSTSKSHFAVINEYLLLAGFCVLRRNVRGRYSVFQEKQQSSKSYANTLLKFFYPTDLQRASTGFVRRCLFSE